MATTKTVKTEASPERYVAAIADEERRKDCEALMALMARISKQPAKMWGTAIVGFGVHEYALAGGKTGEICAVGFSSRKGDISIYGVTSAPGADALLAKLGKYSRGKGCLYVKRLADVDRGVLQKLIDKGAKAKPATAR